MLYRIELKKHLKSVILIFIASVFLMFAGLYKFKGFEGTEGINDLIASIPKIVKYVLGIGEYDLSKISSFYAIIFIYIEVMIFCYSIYLGTSITSKRKLVIMEYTYPCKRKTIVIKRFLAILTILAAITILMMITFILLMKQSGETDFLYIIISFFQLMFASLFFLGLGMLIGNLKYDFSITSMVSLMVVLIFYILFIITQMIDAEFIKYLSPISAVMNNDIISGNWEVIYAGINLILFGGLLVLSIYMFSKKDL